MHENIDYVPRISVEGPSATDLGLDNQAEFGQKLSCATLPDSGYTMAQLACQGRSHLPEEDCRLRA